MNLAGRVVVVTGASHGIGRAMAVALAARDARVVGVGRDRDALQQLSEQTGADVIEMDVADPTHAARLVECVLHRQGAIDVVVANAGIGHLGEFLTMPPERVEALIDVNVRAPVALARAVLPVMVAQARGSLVFVTSVAGAVLVPRETVYSMTKAAIEAFAEPLREELRGSGVHVTTVMPGAVATGFFDRRGQAYGRAFPKPITAERVAAAAVQGIERDTDRVVVPRWLGGPVRLRGVAPGVYRRLARRFG